MKVVIKRVGEKPEVAEIKNSVEELQKIVGGYIECVPMVGNILLVCNKEGKLRGLPINFIFYGDPIVGDVFFCAAGKEDFESLSDEDIEFLMLTMR